MIFSIALHYDPQTKFAKVMFLHVFVCPQGGEGVPEQVPPGRYTSWAATPPGQVQPPAGTPPWAGTPPRPGTPPAGTPPGQLLPQAGTPPGRYTPLGRYTPQEQCMLGNTGNKRAVRILLECILIEKIFLFANCTFITFDWVSSRDNPICKSVICSQTCTRRQWLMQLQTHCSSLTLKSTMRTWLKFSSGDTGFRVLKLEQWVKYLW